MPIVLINFIILIFTILSSMIPGIMNLITTVDGVCRCHLAGVGDILTMVMDIHIIRIMVGVIILLIMAAILLITAADIIHRFMLTLTVINTDKEDLRGLMLTATTEVIRPMLHKTVREGIKAPELTYLV